VSGYSTKRSTLDPGRTALVLRALADPSIHAPFMLSELQRRARVTRRRAWWRAVTRRWGWL